MFLTEKIIEEFILSDKLEICDGKESELKLVKYYPYYNKKREKEYPLYWFYEDPFGTDSCDDNHWIGQLKNFGQDDDIFDQQVAILSLDEARKIYLDHLIDIRKRAIKHIEYEMLKKPN